MDGARDAKTDVKTDATDARQLEIGAVEATVTGTRAGASTADPLRELLKPDADTGKPKRPQRPRGFATLSRERLREIASAGGKAAHAQGSAHQFTTEEARVAGQKGGRAPHVPRGQGAKGAKGAKAKSLTPRVVEDRTLDLSS